MMVMGFEAGLVREHGDWGSKLEGFLYFVSGNVGWVLGMQG